MARQQLVSLKSVMAARLVGGKLYDARIGWSRAIHDEHGGKPGRALHIYGIDGTTKTYRTFRLTVYGPKNAETPAPPVFTMRSRFNRRFPARQYYRPTIQQLEPITQEYWDKAIQKLLRCRVNKHNLMLTAYALSQVSIEKVNALSRGSITLIENGEVAEILRNVTIDDVRPTSQHVDATKADGPGEQPATGSVCLPAEV